MLVFEMNVHPNSIAHVVCVDPFRAHITNCQFISLFYFFHHFPGKNPLHNEDIVIPLALFKEMICYLRVLLESDLTGHHEIAVAALYRLYYASSERLDPLPRLLSAWKSGECLAFLRVEFRHTSVSLKNVAVDCNVSSHSKLYSGV